MPDARTAFRPLVSMHLRALRGQFAAIMLATVVLPLGIIAALDASPLVGVPLQRTNILALSPLLPLLGMAFLVIPPHLARMRESGQMRFFAALPIHRGVLLRSLLMTGALAVLPGVVLTTIWAMDLLHDQALLAVLPLLALVVAALPLAPLGACIGLVGLRQGTAMVWGVCAYAASVGSLIVLIAAKHLTPAAHNLATILPGSLGSDLVAAFLPLSGSRSVGSDLLGLLLYAGGAAYLAFRLVPWRIAAQADPEAIPAEPLPAPPPALLAPGDSGSAGA
jgi:hypothetical protein